MASFPNLRPSARLAKAESGAARSFGSLAALASAHGRIELVSILAFVAVSELATLRGQKALTTSTFPTGNAGTEWHSPFLVGNAAREARPA